MMTESIQDLSEYERNVLQEIAAWKAPSTAWYSKYSDRASLMWNDMTDLARRIPGIEWTIENVVTGLLDLTNEITQDSVWSDAVFKEYRTLGHDVGGHSDILALDLQHVDTATDGLKTKYTALAAAEGTATGLAGLAGIVPDLVALVSLNLRAAGEYATYCGFDVNNPEERLYALDMLNFVAEPSNKAKDVTLAPAVKAASRAARIQSMQTLEQMGLSTAIERAARALGLKLTGAKMAQVVPVTGAVIGGGFNAYYTAKVCTTARHLYRERFLVEKYGEDAVLGS
jgi:hypothetical protein